MRRCKYYYTETTVYPFDLEYMLLEQCLKSPLLIAEDNCHNGLCKYYTPVEIDPYWKDIIDETNRRLYGDRK